MSNDKVLSLLQAASSALASATYLIREERPLPPSPPASPSPISPGEESFDLDEYIFDDDLYDEKGFVVEATPNFWYVPDFNELFVDVALSNGTYGISIGSYSIFMHDTLGPSEEVRGPLGYCRVDKASWTEAKDIRVGDFLYMMNEKAGKVFRGIVTNQPIKGPFCSIRSLENSFVACLGMFADVDLRREVEIVFKVDWEEHCDLKVWADFLQTIDYTKVVRLSNE